jgi:hypothetical protein
MLHAKDKTCLRGVSMAPETHHSRKKRKNAQKGKKPRGSPSWSFLRPIRLRSGQASCVFCGYPLFSSFGSSGWESQMWRLCSAGARVSAVSLSPSCGSENRGGWATLWGAAFFSPGRTRIYALRNYNILLFFSIDTRIWCLYYSCDVAGMKQRIVHRHWLIWRDHHGQ